MCQLGGGREGKGYEKKAFSERDLTTNHKNRSHRGGASYNWKDGQKPLLKEKTGTERRTSGSFRQSRELLKTETKIGNKQAVREGGHNGREKAGACRNNRIRKNRSRERNRVGLTSDDAHASQRELFNSGQEK